MTFRKTDLTMCVQSSIVKLFRNYTCDQFTLMCLSEDTPEKSPIAIYFKTFARLFGIPVKRVSDQQLLCGLIKTHKTLMRNVLTRMSAKGQISTIKIQTQTELSTVMRRKLFKKLWRRMIGGDICPWITWEDDNIIESDIGRYKMQRKRAKLLAYYMICLHYRKMLAKKKRQASKTVV